jgi:hypothetical protein
VSFRDQDVWLNCFEDDVIPRALDCPAHKDDCHHKENRVKLEDDNIWECALGGVKSNPSKPQLASNSKGAVEEEVIMSFINIILAKHTTVGLKKHIFLKNISCA